MPDAPTPGAPTGLRTDVTSNIELIGTAVDVNALAADVTYREILANDFNSVTAENAMKWGVVHPAPDTWRFDDADALVSFAAAHGQRVRGHTLVWHNQLPGYINDTLSAQSLNDALDAHIDGLVGRYKGQVTSWDVVNEAIGDDANLRDSVFLRKLGAGYIEHAFRRAHEVDPDAKLVYNDYDIEWPNPKSDAALALLTDLRQKGVPIDGVGMQFHVSAYDFASFELREAAIRKRIQDFGALGLTVEITELDLRMASLPGSNNAAYQRNVYQRLVAICADEPACTAVTFWGFTDKYSWIDTAYGPDDPLLYNDELQPKPAYDGVRQALRGEVGPGLDFGFDTACGTTFAASSWCAPFEAIVVNPRDYMVASSGQIEVQSATRFRGDRALKASTQAAASAQALIGRRAIRAMTAGTLWGRVYIYIPSSVTATTLTFFSLGENAPPYHGASLGINDGKLQLVATTSGQSTTSTYVMPREVFKCVELRVDVAAGGAATAYVDGIQVATLVNIDTLPAAGMSNVNVGILYAVPATGAYAVYFDEAAYGTARLPCD